MWLDNEKILYSAITGYLQFEYYLRKKSNENIIILLLHALKR